MRGVCFIFGFPCFEYLKNKTKKGALLVEGSEDLLVQNCIFTKLDSNAISINGYNRRATIDSNHFSWLGQNAIASWGRSEYNNGTNGNFPRFTRVTNNFATEVGVIQKQSSMYFQAETAEATIDSNICFNIPRVSYCTNTHLMPENAAFECSY